MYRIPAEATWIREIPKAIMNTPILSIIIPIYNGSKYIGRCIESIYTQNLPAEQFEVICVDDCSTDDTPKVLKQMANLHRNLTTIRHNVNKYQGGEIQAFYMQKVNLSFS